MSLNGRVYAFSDAPRIAGRAERSCLMLILCAGLAGLGWLAAAMATGRALADLLPSCC